MNPVEQFKIERKERIAGYRDDVHLRSATRHFVSESLRVKYSYNFTWLGRPVIQYPQDLLALQEIIWAVKPDLVIETGIAHGGSIIFTASILELLGGPGMVIGIDNDIRSHNRKEIEGHPMIKRIVMIEGSSIDLQVVQRVRELSANHRTVMVFLDSNHTCGHVLEELRLYAPMVTTSSYMVVFDGLIDDMPEYTCQNRPWGPGNNPMTAIRTFLRDNSDFVVDEAIENKLLITAAPSGYLRRIA